MTIWSLIGALLLRAAYWALVWFAIFLLVTDFDFGEALAMELMLPLAWLIWLVFVRLFRGVRIG